VPGNLAAGQAWQRGEIADLISQRERCDEHCHRRRREQSSRLLDPGRESGIDQLDTWNRFPDPANWPYAYPSSHAYRASASGYPVSPSFLLSSGAGSDASAWYRAGVVEGVNASAGTSPARWISSSSGSRMALFSVRSQASQSRSSTCCRERTFFLVRQLPLRDTWSGSTGVSASAGNPAPAYPARSLTPTSRRVNWCCSYDSVEQIAELHLRILQNRWVAASHETGRTWRRRTARPGPGSASGSASHAPCIKSADGASVWVEVP
jgi:hypothetical protein